MRHVSENTAPSYPSFPEEQSDPPEAEGDGTGPHVEPPLPAHIQLATGAGERCVHLMADESLNTRLKVSVQPYPCVHRAAG